LSSIPVFIFIFICTVIAFWFIRRFSRKGLLITSVLCMAIGHVVMAVGLQVHWAPIYTLIPMFIGTGAFTLGLAPLSWVVVSEFFPNRIRSRAMGVVCLFMYSSSFLTAQFFPMLIHWLDGETYWIFCGICIACAGFVWKWVPETKGVSLEKVDELWASQ
jgi:MFS family permease